MKQITFFCAFIFATIVSGAQDREIVIPGNFSNTPLKELLHQIEQRSSYKFFYLESWTDSVKVTGSFSGPLPALLDQALANTNLKYYVIDHKVILTKNI